MNTLKIIARSAVLSATLALRGTAIAGNPALHRLMPWMFVIVLAMALAFATLKLTAITLEGNYKTTLDTEAMRRGLDITAVTMNSNVMGSVAALGLINQSAKGVAQGVTPQDHPAILETLKAIGESYSASGVFLVGKDGIVQSSWDSSGKSSTGLDVRFRPYFQIAMNGKQNVYVAVSLSQGKKAVYLAAPLFDEASSQSPVIGVVSARLESDRLDSTIKAWTSGPALLVSPQGVTFAGNDAELVDKLTAAKTPDELDKIRELKQFGMAFNKGVPKTLPFDIRNDTVMFRNSRYAVSRVPVQWNDPNGEWTLVLLGDLDALMPASLRAKIGGVSGGLVLVLSLLFLSWRQRLGKANSLRQKAEEDLRSNALRLQAESETKTYLATVSADLHQAGSLSEFARKFMLHIAPRVGVDYGEFYAFDAETRSLNGIGSYGAAADGVREVEIGQGLVGQCAKDKAPIVLTDSPITDLRIVWGGGSVSPQTILLLPLVHADSLLGVVVLAALQPIDADRRALLDVLLPMVAANLEILDRNLATVRHAEALRVQQTRTQETEAWYRSIIESSPDGMLAINNEGVIILANPRLDAMFGYEKGELNGQKIEVLVPAAVRGHHPGLRDNFLRTGTSRTMGASNTSLHGIRKDGSEFQVEVALSALPALGGRGVCTFAAVRDITERKNRN